MRLKQRVGDFKVRELLRDGYLLDQGAVRVYRVTKRKLTTPEAIGILAAEAGVDRERIGVAGLKDRQGITVQHMSVVDGREVQLDVDGLRIEPVGFADAPLTSEESLGNAFDINVRALQGHEVAALRTNLEAVREGGLPNYFDDQRFGNLRAGQGWVALDLARGKIEDGLRRLLCEPSPFDDDRHQRLKRGLDEQWGNWAECLDVARRLGLHRSVFEHLDEYPEDFAGAFRFVASRTRLIHLYAWQSHVWNRAVAGWVRSKVDVVDRVVLDSVEGPLVCPSDPLDAQARERDFPLPGAGLEGVDSPEDERLLSDALADDGLVPDQFRVEGVPGFQLKHEPRPLFVVPRHLRVRPSQPDPENRGLLMVRLRFELPRGSYATLVVKRLCSTTVAAGGEERRPEEQRPRGGRSFEDRGREGHDAPGRGRGRSEWRGDRGEERGGRREGPGRRGGRFDDRGARGGRFDDRDDRGGRFGGGGDRRGGGGGRFHPAGTGGGPRGSGDRDRPRRDGGRAGGGGRGARGWDDGGRGGEGHGGGRGYGPRDGGDRGRGGPRREGGGYGGGPRGRGFDERGGERRDFGRGGQDRGGDRGQRGGPRGYGRPDDRERGPGYRGRSDREEGDRGPRRSWGSGGGGRPGGGWGPGRGGHGGGPRDDRSERGGHGRGPGGGRYRSNDRRGSDDERGGRGRFDGGRGGGWDRGPRGRDDRGGRFGGRRDGPGGGGGGAERSTRRGHRPFRSDRDSGASERRRGDSDES